jgi:putative protein-disulfide isomerase
MILAEPAQPISVIAGLVEKGYQQVEQMTGIKFGEDFLWHIFNPDRSDWFPSSLKPAIAMAVLREQYPERQIEFASDLQYALNFEGRDLCDDEAYRHLLEKYNLKTMDFYQNLHSEEFKEKAQYDFALCKQLQVTGFPSVFIQAQDSKFYLVARGYTDYETLSTRIENVLGSTITSTTSS